MSLVIRWSDKDSKVRTERRSMIDPTYSLPLNQENARHYLLRINKMLACIRFSKRPLVKPSHPIYGDLRG
jgi:hypothetical protein